MRSASILLLAQAQMQSISTDWRPDPVIIHGSGMGGLKSG
jgi:hypothetical protein